MIEALIFTFGCVIGLSLGLFIGHIRGKRTGYKAGLVAANRLSPEAQVFDDFLTHTDSTKMQRVECSGEFRKNSDMTPEDVALACRFEYHQLCQNVAQALMNQEIIRPVIVDDEFSPNRDIRRIVISFYIAPDPAFKEYSTLWQMRIPQYPLMTSH